MLSTDRDEREAVEGPPNPKKMLEACSRGDRWLCSVAGLGPIARLGGPVGTYASAVAALAAVVLFPWLDIPYRIVLVAVLFLAGGIVASRAESVYCCVDPRQVVIDELVGMWLVLATIPPSMMRIENWWIPVLGFGFFRLFDITKPWPVRVSESWLPAGFGLMLDDVIAAVYAAAGMWAVTGLMHLVGV
jgi:phosphatidylglycerophosphatase A